MQNFNVQAFLFFVMAKFDSSSLKKPLLGTSKGKGYVLPANLGTSSSKTPFQTFRNSASNAFSNISDTVSGYNPINNVPEDDGPWYKLSQIEVNYKTNNKRLTFLQTFMVFGLCLLLGVVCFTLVKYVDKGFGY
jgi:hypothetical protein